MWSFKVDVQADEEAEEEACFCRRRLEKDGNICQTAAVIKGPPIAISKAHKVKASPGAPLSPATNPKIKKLIGLYVFSKLTLREPTA